MWFVRSTDLKNRKSENDVIKAFCCLRQSLFETVSLRAFGRLRLIKQGKNDRLARHLKRMRAFWLLKATKETALSLWKKRTITTRSVKCSKTGMYISPSRIKVETQLDWEQRQFFRRSFWILKSRVIWQNQSTGDFDHPSLHQQLFKLPRFTR